MDDLTRELVQRIYDQLLDTSDRVLRQCKRYRIELLKMENPSIEQIADHLSQVAEIIWTVCDDFPNDSDGYHVAAKASEYANQVRLIAKAIQRDNQEELNRLVDELDGRPFV